jgi:hypothetical protein
MTELSQSERCSSGQNLRKGKPSTLETEGRSWRLGKTPFRLFSVAGQYSTHSCASRQGECRGGANWIDPLSGKLSRVLVGLGVAALLLATSQAGGSTGPATITITARQTRFTFVDDGAEGKGAGDLAIIQQRLFTRRVTPKAIGRSDIVCTLLSKTTSNCSGIYRLPKGTIVTSGEVDSGLLYELAITGGTELYDNARGSLVATMTSLKPRRQLLDFRLTG